jgi:hypothetical protein
VVLDASQDLGVEAEEDGDAVPGAPGDLDGVDARLDPQ